MRAISVGIRAGVFISEVFRGEDIGLEKVEDHFYKIYFCNLEVGDSMSTIFDFDRVCVHDHRAGWTARKWLCIPLTFQRRRVSSHMPTSQE